MSYCLPAVTSPYGFPTTITAAGAPFLTPIVSNCFAANPTSNAQAGIYTIVLTVTDGTLSSSESFSLTVIENQVTSALL